MDIRSWVEDLERRIGAIRLNRSHAALGAVAVAALMIGFLGGWLAGAGHGAGKGAGANLA
jgi:hypothetical protein